MEKRKKYIAYGSNLNLEQMARRCPTAKVIGAGEIRDHELLFRGYRESAVATVEPKKGASVPVLIWEIGPEDERNLDLMHFDISLYEMYVKGYLEGTDGVLTPEEIESLPWGARLMTLECGMRFLTDYLEGDTYFKTAYPEHNLVRARTQFRLVDEMEQQFEKMQEIVRQYC